MGGRRLAAERQQRCAAHADPALGRHRLVTGEQPNASPASNVLNGVSADSATGAWAVGYYLSKGVRYALILHWNGTAWSVR